MVTLTLLTASNCLNAGYGKSDQILKAASSQDQRHVQITEDWATNWISHAQSDLLEGSKSTQNNAKSYVGMGSCESYR